MGDPGLPVMAGLLAVPVIVLLFVTVLALMGGRRPAPAGGPAEVYEDPEDVVADFDPWPYAHAQPPAPVSTALAPRPYGSLGRDPHGPAYEPAYGYGATGHGRPYRDDPYALPARDSYGRDDAPGARPSDGFPHGPYPPQGPVGPQGYGPPPQG